MSAPVELVQQDDGLSEPLLPTNQKESSALEVEAVEVSGDGRDRTVTTDDPSSMITEPLLVQQIVNDDTASSDGVDGQNQGQFEDESTRVVAGRGQVQPKAFRDWPWAVLFLIQLLAIIALAAMGIIHLVRKGKSIIDWWDPDHDDNDNGNGNGGGGGGSGGNVMSTIVFLLILTGCIITVSTILMTLLLGPLSGMMIQISLVLSPICFGFTAVVSLLTLNIPMLIFSSIMMIFGIMYAVSVWNRIPFATANIKIAMTALRDNHGLWILGYVMTLKAYIWTALWSLAVLEIVVYNPDWIYQCTPTSGNDGGSSTSNTDDDVPVECDLSHRGKFMALALLLSFFWTSQVLKNVFHTTIAGVVGTWWFDPDDARSASALAAARSDTVMEQGGILDDGEDNDLAAVRSETGLGHDHDRSQTRYCCSFCGCSPAIFDSWTRSTVYSFGSICFGSLLVGILRVLQTIIKCGRQRRQEQRDSGEVSRSGSGDLFCCLLECLVDHLERLMEYFNQWSFVYVGLYGYSYIDAGKQVAALFNARGWSVIINDYLVSRSLAMMTLLIGLCTGVMGVVIGFLFFGPLGAVPYFFIGAVLGMTSCNIQFGVVVSAINTIVVAFAEAPESLRMNHSPVLYDELVRAWREAYPQQFGL